MELVTDLRSICWHTHNCEVPGDCYGPTNLTSVACFLFFSPAMSNYIFTMLVFTFHEWISCLSQWWFFVFAIGDDFRMTSIWYQSTAVMEFQAWEYKITNNHEQIHKKNSEMEKSCANKIFYYVHTPTPWLMGIRFTWISLTRLFKTFPFLT